ncbi:MAG: Pre-mRNA-splicing factor [Tremellales sp. Tagirdzhanova-0007]|nr:MAG: Pre-mRNA-splicing factor [Tremellales sp. Tagirdzhanova-0007]
MSETTTITAKRKLRPARKQVKAGDIDKSEGPQPGKEYNLWYNKWAGGDKEDALASHVALYPETLDIHEPMLRATNFAASFSLEDVVPMGAFPAVHHPLQHAEMDCFFRHECNFLHRLPLPSHQLPDHSRDCFGRERHADYRDDMGGVGSFNRSNRTLYIGKMQESPDKKQTEETLMRHFGEWGTIVKWNILYNRGIAFVTYESEHSASFSKEAMANQSMDMEEILNVRWATEDPNPTEKVAEDKRIEEEGQKAISGMLDENLVEAAQTLRALEDGDEQDFYPIESSAPEPDDYDERPSKRSKSGGLGKGMFDDEAMENMRFYAEMARKQAVDEADRRRKLPSKPAGVASLLSGYGSGNESD